MATTRTTSDTNQIFDQLCDAITHEQGATDASLKTAHILAANVGPNELVGLESGGVRPVEVSMPFH